MHRTYTMNPDRPNLNGNDVLEVLLRGLHNPMDRARKDAAVLLRQCDTREAALALGEAWSEEDDNQVAIAILDSLRAHDNDVAARLVHTMESETAKQRESIGKAVDPHSK